MDKFQSVLNKLGIRWEKQNRHLGFWLYATGSLSCSQFLIDFTTIYIINHVEFVTPNPTLKGAFPQHSRDFLAVYVSSIFAFKGGDLRFTPPLATSFHPIDSQGVLSYPLTCHTPPRNVVPKSSSLKATDKITKLIDRLSFFYGINGKILIQLRTCHLNCHTVPPSVTHLWLRPLRLTYMSPPPRLHGSEWLGLCGQISFSSFIFPPFSDHVILSNFQLSWSLLCNWVFRENSVLDVGIVRASTHELRFMPWILTKCSTTLLSNQVVNAILLYHQLSWVSFQGNLHL